MVKKIYAGRLMIKRYKRAKWVFIMKYCKKCLYPDTKPQLIFDENGVCSACNNND